MQAGIAVPNVQAALQFYTEKLGFQIAFTWGDAFAGVSLGQVQIFLAEGVPAPTSEGAVAYFQLSDANPLYEFHRAAGVEIVEPIGDRPYGIRDYTVRDPYGHALVFGHHLRNAGDPIRIERVDVPVRLEKRLAALLHDLAMHKGMSVNSCLEEILLHTNDGVEPHTKSQLRYIQELKKKHGIGYDTHASYRFVEE
jgi:uncharacterized glyoxalase superfamily protein PhnB